MGIFGPFQPGLDTTEYVLVPVVGGWDITSETRRTDMDGKVHVFKNWVCGTFGNEFTAIRMMKHIKENPFQDNTK